MMEAAASAPPSEILVIGDGESEATSLAGVLSDAQATLVVVHDRDEAVEYLSATGRHDGRDAIRWPDLIVLDLGPNDYSGHRILRWIRWELGITRTPVVVLTSSSRERDIRDAYRFGANSYVLKPERMEELPELAAQIVHYWLRLNV